MDSLLPQCRLLESEKGRQVLCAIFGAMTALGQNPIFAKGNAQNSPSVTGGRYGPRYVRSHHPPSARLAEKPVKL